MDLFTHLYELGAKVMLLESFEEFYCKISTDFFVIFIGRYVLQIMEPNSHLQHQHFHLIELAHG